MAKNRKKATVALPPTTCAYAWIDKPDTGHKFSNNKYKTTLVYDDFDDVKTVKDGKESADLDEIIDELALEAHGDKEDFKLEDLQRPYRLPEAQTKEDFEGKTTMNVSSKYKPSTFDAKRKKLPKGVKIMSGDLVACVVTLMPYESSETVKENGKKKTETIYGVSAQLSAIQLVEKRSGGGGAGMFDDYEDGFDGSEYEDQVEDDENAEENDDDDGDY